MFLRKKISYLIVAYTLVALISCEQNKPTAANEKIVDSSSSTNALNFMIIGDWGRQGEYHQKDVANQMDNYVKNNNTSFVIATGDNFYDNGVESIKDTLWALSYEGIYNGDNLKDKKWYVVLGNHDHRGNPTAEIAYSQTSNRWTMPDYYFIRKEKVSETDSALFIYIDTTPLVKEYYEEPEKYAYAVKQDTAKQMRWIDSVLAASKDRWKFVVGHHPVYSGSPKHGNTPELIATLKPLMEKYKVDAYFCGHDHDLQHLKEANGTVDYFVSGAGSETRPTGNLPSTKFAKDISGFAGVSLTKDTLKLAFIDYQGNVLCQTVRSK